MYIGGRFPPWFYALSAQASLIAPIKLEAPPQPDGSAGVPDVRPIAMGNVLRRLITRAAMRHFTPLINAYLRPAQLGVGESRAGAKLAIGLNLLLQARPEFVLVKTDIRNCFNELHRQAMLDALARVPTLSALRLLAEAELIPHASLYAGQDPDPLPFSSAEGVQQGCGYAGALVCITLQPYLLQARAALVPLGGIAVAGMDDVYFLGPPAAVFPIVETFATRVAPLGAHLQPAKSAWFSHQPDAVVPRAGHIPRGQSPVDAEPPGGGFGVQVWGVPVGDDAYINASLRAKTTEIVCASQNMSNLLGDHQSQALWTILFHSLSRRFDFWLQSLPPRITLPHAARVDVALRRMACVAINTPELDLLADPTTLIRLQLPARHQGCGIRSTEATAPAAFMGTLLAVLPELPDIPTRAGIIPSLGEALIPDPALPPGGRWGHFLATHLPLADDFADAWERIRAVIPAATQELPPACRAEGTQRALTRAVEAARYDRLCETLHQRDVHDRARRVFFAVDDSSAMWCHSWPAAYTKLDAATFAEHACRYLSLPSPLLRPYVGMRIRGDVVCDPWGDKLSTAPLPGDGWRTQHTCILRTLISILKTAAEHVTIEPLDLFDSALNAEGMARFASLTEQERHRQGIIPDGLVHWELPREEYHALPTQLLELKTAHFGPSVYKVARNPEPRAAVDFVGANAARSYSRRAAKLDRDFCLFPDGTPGPVTRKLRALGGVTPVVSGHFGELNHKGVELLVTAARRAIALGRSDKRLDARCAEVGFVAQQYRRQLAFCAYRCNYRLLWDRTTCFRPAGASGRAQRANNVAGGRREACEDAAYADRRSRHDRRA